jgi:predicted DNA-binding transcriptional regulator YafY
MPSRREQLYRQLRLLRKIQLNPNLKAKDLALDLEVSHRTVFRDIKSLMEWNFPIFYDNGYRLSEDYFLPNVNLDIEEMVALFLSSRFLSDKRDLPYYRPLGTALEKIEAVLKPEYRKLLEAMESRFAIGIPEGVYEETSIMVMELINKAILHHKSLEVVYHTFSSNSTNRRVIDPYGLFFMQDNWYIVAFCHLRQCIREFNIKRIREATLTENLFTLPAGFDVSQYVNHSWDFGEAEPAPVKTRHTPFDARRIRETQWHPSQKIEECDDGYLLLSVKVRAPENMIPWLLGRKGEVELLEPEFLRKIFQEEVRAILAIYDKRGF